MPEFNIRSDSVNVEQIMEQIRARIREKRGVDYTEQQIRELAAVKLETFLDPRGVRSDLLEQFRRAQAPIELPNYAFEDTTLYETHRGPIRWIRKLLNPILKLFLNPNPLIQALHIQARLNTLHAEQLSRQRAVDQLHYEVMHNLVVELTRLGIETKNLKMRVESVASRLEFNERRARALESVVAYKPATERESVYDAPPAHSSAPPPPQPQGAPPPAHHQGGSEEGPGQRSRRRRRRRGRRGGGAPGGPVSQGQPQMRPEDRGPSTTPSTDAPSANESHSPAAETVQRAVATESHPAEHGAEPTASPAPAPTAPPAPTPPDPDHQ